MDIHGFLPVIAKEGVGKVRFLGPLQGFLHPSVPLRGGGSQGFPAPECIFARGRVISFIASGSELVGLCVAASVPKGLCAAASLPGFVCAEQSRNA
jgi:hypothetical protein